MWTRRAFLKTGSLALFSATLGGTPLFLTRTAQAAPAQMGDRRRTLVCIFQRGAMDGLMAVQPLGDASLQSVRPQLHMALGGKGLLELDGRFGLHPGLSALHPAFRSGKLAIVHGVGSPDSTRSHFDAQDYMETGTPGRKGTASGWLNRATGLLGHEATPFQSVAITRALPRSLYGPNPALAIANLDQFQVQVGRGKRKSVDTGGGKSLEEMYRETSQDLLRGTGSETFDAMKILSSDEFRNYRPRPGANYPGSGLGQSLRQMAQLIKAGVGLEVGFAESGGWDTHVRQGTENGTFFQRGNELAQAIAAFWTDLGEHQDKVTVMTMTEFGRTVAQNGSGGTDHGRGSCLFVLGNDVVGGRVYGSVPELAKENLEDGRDLPVTTDFRAVFSEVAAKHLQLASTGGLFPGWGGRPLSLLRS
ncbi:MAG: DUF1501 domain-containing protein [Candidatus Eremiobacteraeota bacterium]|nr:DUF1501 domain-containing protein [Candidatus Eremiobacteraeota bacterium]